MPPQDVYHNFEDQEQIADVTSVTKPPGILGQIKTLSSALTTGANNA